jgi:molybdopterin/thiamine biosynthesis adenylyltransferase
MMKDFLLRYQRQITLEGFGMEAQTKLSNAKIMVVGAGGLGCPALQYLAAAGVGTIGIVDNDLVGLSNLNRQILFGQEDVGKAKVHVAANKIKALNELVKVHAFQQTCDANFAANHFPDYDVIIDATDNFASRYLINDACVLFNKPLVFGAVSQFEGQVAVFNLEIASVKLNYRDLFPEPPKNDEVLSCAEGGVLGVLPGIIGVMQATEAIKLIAGVGETLANQMLTYNALTNSFYKMQLIANPLSQLYLPKNIEIFKQMNYEQLCN